MTTSEQDQSLETAIRSIPCDPELLAPIGLVTWAAIRLQHGVRDVYDTIRGYPSSDLFLDTPLGSAVEKLRKSTAQVSGPLKTSIEVWCTGVARPAVWARNGVAHAVAYTASGGRQGIGDIRSGPLEDYDRAKLVAVALQLREASASLYPVLCEARDYRLKRPISSKNSASAA